MNFDSFSTAPWFDSSYSVIIGGVGNIGSWTSFLLSRMGYQIILYDMDIIEQRNLGSQLYRVSDAGKKKVESLRDTIKVFSGNSKVSIFQEYNESSMTGNIVISCFDNMAARQIMFDKWVAHQEDKIKKVKSGEREKDPTEVNIFIDGRSLAEMGIVYAVKSPHDVKRYREEFFNDSEVEPQVCSFKSTSHNGAMIASVITSILCNHIVNKKQGENIRAVPFKVEYELPLLTFRTYD